MDNSCGGTPPSTQVTYYPAVPQPVTSTSANGTPPAFPSIEPFHYSNYWGICVLGNCSGGRQYLGWWNNWYRLRILGYMGQDISDFSKTVGPYLGPTGDIVKGLWGKDIVPPKLGYGLDAFVQLGKDGNRTDLTLGQRLGRASLVGFEGVAIDFASKWAGVYSMKDSASVAANVSATTLQPEFALPILGGSFLVGYVTTNIGLSTLAENVANPYLFSNFNLGSP